MTITAQPRGHQAFNLLDPHAAMVYVSVLDADDNGDTFAYARQVRLGPAVEP